MESPAHLKAVLASLAAASLALFTLFSASAADGEGATAKRAEAGRQKLEDRPAQNELEFKGLDFETDRFIVDDFFEMVRMQRLQKNISGGVTPDGLNLRFDW